MACPSTTCLRNDRIIHFAFIWSRTGDAPHMLPAAGVDRVPPARDEWLAVQRGILALWPGANHLAWLEDVSPGKLVSYTRLSPSGDHRTTARSLDGFTLSRRRMIDDVLLSPAHSSIHLHVSVRDSTLVRGDTPQFFWSPSPGFARRVPLFSKVVTSLRSQCILN